MSNRLQVMECTCQNRPAAPLKHEGLMVFIGCPRQKDALVLVRWTPLGQELRLLDRIREGSHERAMVLATVYATPAEVDAFRAHHKKAWRCGYWYARTHAFSKDLRRAARDDSMAPVARRKKATDAKGATMNKRSAPAKGKAKRAA